MKANFIFILAITLLAGSSTLFAKGFLPPQNGKAVVYFVRVTNWGGPVSFEFFHQDKYIGVFKKKNYMRYECDPGKQLFWASSENKEFITGDLVAGKSYIVIVDVIMGGWKAHVGLEPITTADAETFGRAKELIMENDPVVTPSEKIDKMNMELASFITEKLSQYNEVWKKEKDFSHISPEMAIPDEAMK